jgi:hypothetical protein
VSAFGDFEEAIVWLWDTEESEKFQPAEEVEEVAVKTRRRPVHISRASRN